VAGGRVQLRWPAVGNIGVRTRYRVLVDGSRVAETRSTRVALRRGVRARRVQVVVVGPDGFRFAGPARVLRLRG
jgi:hypothetical protein